MKGILKGQTVRFFELEKTENGAAKISFVVADRIKKMNTISSTGSRITGPFIKCIAFGRTATMLNEEFNILDGEKLKSKKIDLYGDLSFFNEEREIKLNASLNVGETLKDMGYQGNEDDFKRSIDVELATTVNIQSPLFTVKEFEYVEPKVSNTFNVANSIRNDFGIDGDSPKLNTNEVKENKNQMPKCFDVEKEVNNILEIIN